MCDFSLQAMKSRPASVGDKLITHNFGTGTSGFRDAEEDVSNGTPCTAICVMPGTEIGFDQSIKTRQSLLIMDFMKKHTKYNVAIFRQVKKDEALTHHDALELPDGQIFMLTSLESGQKASILQLPAAPKDESEAQEQKRLEIVA